MRSFALTLALVASSQLVLASTPAWAQGPTAPPPATPATTDTAATPPTTPAPAAPRATDGTVQVHVESTLKVNLERRTATTAAWEFVCESPCDQRTAVGYEYRVTGKNVNDSRPFQLDTSKGDTVVVRVAPGEKDKERLGTYVLIGGGALIVAGIIIMAVGVHPSQTFRDDGTTNNTNWDVLTVGTAMIVGGVVGGLVGSAFVINNGHSRAGGDVQAAPPARGSLPLPQTGMRTPGPVAPQLIVPLFSTTF